eukprot:1159037-Pelagomonas_calceolata.AAC.4
MQCSTGTRTRYSLYLEERMQFGRHECCHAEQCKHCIFWRTPHEAFQCSNLALGQGLLKSGRLAIWICFQSFTVETWQGGCTKTTLANKQLQSLA